MRHITDPASRRMPILRSPVSHPHYQPARGTGGARKRRPGLRIDGSERRVISSIGMHVTCDAVVDIPLLLFLLLAVAFAGKKNGPP